MDFKTASKLDNNQAREYLEKLRWDGKPFCPHCGSMSVTKLQGKSTRPGVHKCKDKNCRKQFTVTVGTIFEDSHIELRHWVMAFCLICSSKKGISALQLQRMLGLGSYKSAWHMAHRIRHAMQQEPMRGLLQGTIEVDETFIGGKPRSTDDHFTRRKKWSKKTPVVALIQRDGGMRTKAMRRITSKGLRRAMENHCDFDNSRLMTDQRNQYRMIGREFKGGHGVVQHDIKEYSRGDVHVNSCESFFALLKRGVHGTFHHVSTQHLQRYADEFAFRWNHRKVTDAERTEAALMMAPGCRLTYKQ